MGWFGAPVMLAARMALAVATEVQAVRVFNSKHTLLGKDLRAAGDATPQGAVTTVAAPDGMPGDSD